MVCRGERRVEVEMSSRLGIWLAAGQVFVEAHSFPGPPAAALRTRPADKRGGHKSASLHILVDINLRMPISTLTRPRELSHW